MPTNITISLDELIEVGVNSKGVSFLPHYRSNSILSGKYASKLRGRGMDFLELRSYGIGDDVRHIDWRATRRTGKTYVRAYSEEKNRTVYIMLSQQSNMFFGSKGCFKSVQAARLASISLYSSLSNGEKVGAVLYDDENIYGFDATKDETKSMRFLHEIQRVNNLLPKRETKTDTQMFNKALDYLLTKVKHDDLIIMIGDASAMDKQSSQKITRLSQHNNIIGAIVYDKMERKLPSQTNMLFRDFDSFLEVDASKKSFKKRYNSLYEQKIKNYTNLSLAHKIPVFEINTDEDLLTQIKLQLGLINARY